MVNVQRYVCCPLTCWGSPAGHALHCWSLVSVWWGDWIRRWPFHGCILPECAVQHHLACTGPAVQQEEGIHLAGRTGAQRSRAARPGPGLAFCVVWSLHLHLGRIAFPSW